MGIGNIVFTIIILSYCDYFIICNCFNVMMLMTMTMMIEIDDDFFCEYLTN